MTSLKDSYNELLALTQLYLLRECPHMRKLPVSPDALHHYISPNNPQKEARNRPLSPPQKVEQPVLTKLKEHSNRPINEYSSHLKTEKTAPPLQPLTTRDAKETPSTTTQDKEQVQDSKEKKSIAIHTSSSLQANKIIEEHSPSDQNPVLPPSVTSKDVKKTFTLTPLPPHQPPLTPSHELWTFLQTHFTQIALQPEAPDDTLARKKKNQWQEQTTISPILILSFDKDDKYKAFLKAIAKAITLRFTPAKVIDATEIEKENRWDTILNHPAVKLIIASDYHLYLQPNLMQYHQENPLVGKHFLNHLPLLLLSELKFYFGNNKMKAYLWRAICTEFTSLGSMTV